ncbi:UNVERIFIED_CONTAM: hypothetical protein FKN15_049963 [Acipenser sinensis]
MIHSLCCVLFQTSLSIWGWGGLGAVLFLITFGPFAIFYLAFYILCFTGGCFAVTLLFGKTNSEKLLEKCEHSFLPATQPGIPKVIQFALRDYIQSWYYTLSDDESFLLEIRQTVQNALVQFSTRSKEVDWQPYFTTRLVDDFATHLRVFRKAQERMTEKDDQKLKDEPEELLESFFEAEVEMERKICRDLVCTSTRDEEGFLRDLCEVLLYLLLPSGDFHNKNMRYFVREILARGILLPLINQLSDPDYINQYVIWMIHDSSCNYEAFMNILKLSDKVGELEAVKDKAVEELQFLRSLDTAGDDYMQQKGGQADLFFWLTVEGYRVTAQQQLEVLQNWQKDGKKQTNQTKGLLKAAALGVYEQYLSEKVNQSVELETFHPPPFQSDREQQLDTLCPVRALAYYVDRTKSWRQSEQYVVCYGNKSHGQALSKLRLSKWIADTIRNTYELASLPPPEKLTAHSTKCMATLWALFQGASVKNICNVAVWATFIRFYRLNVVDPQNSGFGFPVDP